MRREGTDSTPNWRTGLIEFASGIWIVEKSAEAGALTAAGTALAELTAGEIAPGSASNAAHCRAFGGSSRRRELQIIAQAQTRGHRVDSRSDIFSLGVVIYEMITGHKPFPGGSMSDVMAAILEKEPPPITKYLPQAPAELQWILSKTLAKDREARYQTVRELLNDLKRLKQQIEFKAEQTRSAQTEPLGEPSGIRRRSGSFGSHPSYDTDVIEPPVTTSAQYVLGGIKRHKTSSAIAILLLAAAVGLAGYFWSSSRLSSSTLTVGSPKKPSQRPSVWSATACRT